MATTIEVNKQSVKQLLETGKDNIFLIPEYKRPYAWEYEQIDTLFNDLWEFATVGDGGSKKKGTYFLGSIVTFKEEGQQKIVDGQQRITSLFLLIRAIYTMLKSSSTKTKEAENFIKQIEPTLWQTDNLTGEVDYSSILITSYVMNDDGNEILRAILESGKADKNAKDNYSKNYLHLQELLEKAAKENPLAIFDFIYALLNQAIMLPIEADNQDTALTIFSTLNDRGLQLSDADIFKAKIYGQLDIAGKAHFIEKWKALDEEATEASESIQSLFYYYMFYLRAREGVYDSTIQGARKYYSANSYKRLFAKGLIDDLAVVLKIWKVTNQHVAVAGEVWSENHDIVQALDILRSYPNEYWKYPVVTYYLVHRSEVNFESNFLRFLRKLLIELLTKYLLTPTVNAVKSDILKLNVEIISNAHPRFDFKPVDSAALKVSMKTPHKNAVRMLLKMLAYKEQDTLLPEKWEIEHILPQKWQSAYFMSESDEVILEKIEHLGNKLPFEKKLNIIAGNGYFDKKKKEYASSAIAITKAMSGNPSQDWKLDDITERNVHTVEAILDMIEGWNKAYDSVGFADNSLERPSAEELALIEKFKSKGWVNS